MARFVESLGYVEIRVTGAHHFFEHPDGRTAMVPIHSDEDLGRGLMRKILRDLGVTRATFLRWCNRRK
jgi:predicted RNA binding protein YcfA (HicA-like mRNA interferase family)